MNKINEGNLNELKKETPEFPGLGADFGCDGDGVNSLMLTSLETIRSLYIALLKGEEKNFDNYKKNLYLLFKEFKKDIKNLKKENKLNHEIEKDLLLKLVTKIGVLGKYMGFNNGQSRLIKANPEFDTSLYTDIIHQEDGENSFFVPGCFLNLNRLVEQKIVGIKSISLKLGNGVNFQEGIGFVNAIGELGKKTIQKYVSPEKLEQIKISVGDNCSFAHSSAFFNGNRQDIIIKAGNGVFFGINSLVGSGTEIGNFSTIWWNSNVGNNVKIGKSCIIGTSCVIEDDVVIEDDCLVPDFFHISRGFEVVKFSDYKNNLDKYNSRNNFVIQLSNLSKKESSKNNFPDFNNRSNQLDFISPTYNFIRKFNKHNVVPENKIFASIEDIFAFLEISIGFKSTQIIEYGGDEVAFDEKLKNSKFEDNSIKSKINGFSNGKRKSRLVLKAFPKNPEKFLSQDFGSILEQIDQSKDHSQILKDLEKLLERPKIDIDSINTTFYGNCYITGKFEYSGNCLFYNLKSRGDELSESQKISILNGVIISGIVHGGGDKEVSNTCIIDTTIHGPSKYTDSKIGVYGKPSVGNNSEIYKSTIGGEFTANGSIINYSKLEDGVSLSGGGGDSQIVINSSNLGEEVSVQSGTTISGSNISGDTIIGKYLEVNGHNIKNKIKL